MIDKDGLPEVDSLLRFDLLKFNYELIQEVVNNVRSQGSF